MIFISYAKNHAGDSYCMYNLSTGNMTETRDIMWLHHKYQSKPGDRDEVVEYLQAALIFKHKDEEASKSKDDKKECSSMHNRSGRL